MKLLKQPGELCLIYSAAMVLDEDPNILIDEIGFTGEEKGLYKDDTTKSRGIHIQEIIDTSETIIISHKTSRERVLYFSDSAIKEIKKYFTFEESELGNYCITSWGNPQKTFHEVSLIQLVNKYMKNILGDNYTSHSFRQGLITEMGSKNINPRVIQSFIGHQNVSTTLNYIKPTENDIKDSLVR